MYHGCVVCQQPTLRRCSRCQAAYYCGAEHQKQDRASHRAECVEPFQDFLLDDMFNSYYDGALMVYLYATTFEFGNDRVKSVFDRFVCARIARVNAYIESNTAKSDAQTLDFQKLAENRAAALEALERVLRETVNLDERQQKILEPVLAKHREQLKEGEKPMGYVAGYAHACLEIMQRLLQPDLSNKDSATELGAAAIATCTVALQVALERLEKFKEATTK